MGINCRVSEHELNGKKLRLKKTDTPSMRRVKTAQFSVKSFLITTAFFSSSPAALRAAIGLHCTTVGPLVDGVGQGFPKRYLHVILFIGGDPGLL